MGLRTAIFLTGWAGLVAAAVAKNSTPESLYLLAAAFAGSVVSLLGRCAWRRLAGLLVILVLAWGLWPVRLWTHPRFGSERFVISDLDRIRRAEEQWRAIAGGGGYMNLAGLGSGANPLIDPFLSAGNKSGYSFVVGVVGNTFTARAAPVNPGETGVARSRSWSNGFLEGRWPY